MIRRCLGCRRRIARGSRCTTCLGAQKAPYSDPEYIANRMIVLKRDAHTCQMIRNGRKCCRYATTANHKLALANGGTNAVDNLEAACLKCNSGKRERR